MLAKDLHALCDFLVTCFVCSGQDDRSGIFDLVDEEFAEILDIELAFCRVHNGNSAAQLHISAFRRILNGFHDIGKLAHARRLDEDPLRRIVVHDFPEGSTEIAD